MKMDVVEVKAGHDWNMQVRFADGTQGSVKFEQSHLYGVFESLKDPLFFAQAYLDSGVVSWPGNHCAGVSRNQTTWPVGAALIFV